MIISDAVQSSVKSVSLFGILQKLFTLFSASVKRWSILNDYLKKYTLKKLSDTRWEARIDSVKALRYQYCNVYNALVTLAKETEESDPLTSYEAITLGEHLKDFSFIVSLITWHDILFQINVISKASQSPDADIVKFTEMLNRCCFMQDYRKTGFEKAIETAKNIASELGVDPIFKPLKRVRRIKRHFDEKARDQPIENAEKSFEVNFFNTLLDTVISALNERFEQLYDFSATWNFLFDLKKLPKKEELFKHCADLQIKLTVNGKSDIEGYLLCDKLLSLQSFLRNKQITTQIEVLNFIKN